MIATARRIARHGFTLLEVSIVLIIMGLIIGGLLIGRELIESAGVRAVIRDVDSYKSAVLAFQTKYNALPGDMRTAETYWGTDPGGCPATPTNTVRKQATCNGDGMGNIINPFDAATYPEMFRAVQQLANAGLIEGSYTGATGPGGAADPVIGLNIPQSRSVAPGGYLLYWAIGLDTAIIDYFPGPYSHIIAYGSFITNDMPLAPVFTPTQARNIDEKLDDGRPGLGNVMSFKPAGTYCPSCATTNDPDTSEYDISSTAVRCSLLFKMGF